MGKDQELLEGARNGSVTLVEKILTQRAKRSGPLASLRRGPGANVQDSSGYTPLHHAALNGHKEIVRMLLEHEASPNVPDTKGSSPLHLAAWAGHTDIVRLLLTHGPAFTNVNLATRDNETALHCAAQYGHTAVVSMLLNHGADPTVRSLRDETALDLACQYGRLETVELLVRMHPELLEPYRAPRGFFPNTPLHRASKNGHRAVVNILLSTGHAPNARTPAGTALHEAALCGKADVARALLAGGADPRARDTKGATVLDVLSQFPERATHDIVKLINKYRTSNGVDSDSEDLPPIPVSNNMLDGPDSPYDNVRSIPGSQFSTFHSQGHGRSRNNQQPNVWERRDEDERRVSATSNISMSKDIVPSKPKFSPIHGINKSNNSSRYMLMLTSGCFGAKEKSSSSKLHRIPSDCYQPTVIKGSKSESNISTLRIGRSKFFRRKFVDTEEKLIVLPKNTHVEIRKIPPVRKKSSVIKKNAPSLPNILESVEKSNSDDSSSASSEKIENNPVYDSFENIDRNLLTVPGGVPFNIENIRLMFQDSSSSNSEEDTEDALIARLKNEVNPDASIASTRSSFEFQTSDVDLDVPKLRVNSDRSNEKPSRNSDSNITLKNWSEGQTHFKNAPNYSQVSFGYQNVRNDFNPANHDKKYYAMLDFSRMLNSESNDNSIHHDYEPIEFNDSLNSVSEKRPVVLKSVNSKDSSNQVFKPIEVFKGSSTVFVEIDNLSTSSRKSEEHNESSPKRIVGKKRIKSKSKISDSSNSRSSIISTTNSESSSRSLSLVDSLDSKSTNSKKKIVTKIQRTFSKLTKKGKMSRSNSNGAGKHKVEDRSSKLVNVGSERESISSAFFIPSDNESIKSLTLRHSEDPRLSFNSILKLSHYNRALSGSYGSLEISTLRQIGEIDDPIYQNVRIIPKNYNRFQDIPQRKTTYHLKGSDNCMYSTPAKDDHVYIFNHNSLNDTYNEPFLKIPRRLLGSASDMTICFCDKGDQKIYVSADNIFDEVMEPENDADKNKSSKGFVCYCHDDGCCSHHSKNVKDLLTVTYKPLTHSISFPNLKFSSENWNENPEKDSSSKEPLSEKFNIVFDTPFNDKPDAIYSNVPSAFSKYGRSNDANLTQSLPYDFFKNKNVCDIVVPDSSPSANNLDNGESLSVSPDVSYLEIANPVLKITVEDESLKPDQNTIRYPLYIENPLSVSKNIENTPFENISISKRNIDSSLDRKLAIDTIENALINRRPSPKYGGKFNTFGNEHSSVSVASSVRPSLTGVGGRLCVRSGSDGGHYPYSRSQAMEGSYHSEELSSSYQSGRVREADQLSISSTTSSTGGPSPRERQRCGTNDSSVSGGNVYLPTGSSGYHAYSPGSNNKVSPTPPKKPPRRNLSVSPTHLLPPLFPAQGGSTGGSSQPHHLARAHQTRSQDDLDDIQVPGSKLAGLRHGRSVDQYVDNDLKTSPRARPVPQPRPSLALLASRKEQPVAISTMYENVVVKEINPKRKLRRNQYENYQPGSRNHDDDSYARNQKYNSSQERSSLESLLDDVGSFHGGTPSDVESRPCRNRPTIQTPLSPTHYEQPPTPEHPPPSAKQAEMSIHEKMRPLSQEYKRMSRDMETEIDLRYLGRCSSPSSSASTDHCVEEYVAEIPFGGLFKGSTTNIDGAGVRPTPAERPKSLRTLKNVYDGGGPLNYHGNPVNQNNQIQYFNHQAYQGKEHNYQGGNQAYHGTHINQIDRTGMYKTELEDPWQYRAGREPREEKKDATGSTGALEKSLSILSPFDEQEEWAKISEIMASFGSKLVRESVFAEELEREFQSRLGLASAIARRTPSPAPEALQEKADTIPTWLNSIGLGHLELNFINNGYDELQFINGVIEDNDFEEMAISEPDKSRILEAVQSIPRKIEHVMSLPRPEDTHNNNVAEKNGDKPEDPAAVNKWLQSIGLECYQDTFRKHLYADMERVRRIWEVELTAVLEIQKVGHRRRILASVAGRQNGPVSNMEDIKADLNNLLMEIATMSRRSPYKQKNIQNLKAEIKDIPVIETNVNNSLQLNQITSAVSQVQKSPSIHSQTSIAQSQTSVQNNTANIKNTAAAGPTLVPPGGETLKRSHKKNRPPPPPPTGRDLEIRAPCELLVGVPGALKTQWRHQPFALVTSSVMYVANYLGSTIVKELRGTESTQKSIQKLKKTNQEPRALPDIILSISYRGVKFLNTITRELVCEHEIRNIHCACQDADDLTHFAYITKDITTKNHYCHVFCVATMDQATEVILTLGQAFEVAYQMALREMAPKNQPSVQQQQQQQQQQPRSQSANQISQQQSKTPTHEKTVSVIAKDKNNPVHGRSHSVTEIKLNGHQLKVAPITVSLSNEDFQLSAKNGNVQESPRTPSAKAPIAVAEEL